MDVVSILKIAWRALARNKMRSILTMLGIIIGVGAVIAMVGLGQGAQEQVQAQIAAMGSNMLFVIPGSVNRGGMHMGWGATKTLIYADKEAILKECPAVRDVAPLDMTQAQIVFGNDNWYTTVNGTEPQYFDIREWPLAEGAAFTRADVESNLNLAVIGETVRRNLFGTTDPIGQTIRIKRIPFTVVGLLTRKGQGGMGNDQDDNIYVPLTTLQKKVTGTNWLRMMMVSATSKDSSYAAQQQITSLLRDRHRIRPGQDDDFFVRNLADIAEMADQAGSVMTMLLASIAGVSLIVGGIGIMNIMLVSVTERTREIGIRMAIGATEEDVQSQFLIEAVVLSCLGGAIGIFAGVGTALVLTNVLGWNVSISVAAIVTAVVFSMGIGIFFGFYPARKAARLDPIEALRYE